MHEITLYFEMCPVAKQRARVARGHAYTPKKTSDFEKRIKLMAQTQYRGPQMLGPLSVSIKFVLPRPKARKHDTWVSVRPDIDNYIKAILDSLNEIVWQDDGQVAELYASKKYETKECGPRIVVTVTSL